MVLVSKTPINDIKKRKARKVKEEEIDYSKLPGIVVFKTEADWYNFQTMGKLPKGYK